MYMCSSHQNKGYTTLAWYVCTSSTYLTLKALKTRSSQASMSERDERVLWCTYVHVSLQKSTTWNPWGNTRIHAHLASYPGSLKTGSPPIKSLGTRLMPTKSVLFPHNTAAWRVCFLLRTTSYMYMYPSPFFSASLLYFHPAIFGEHSRMPKVVDQSSSSAASWW